MNQLPLTAVRVMRSILVGGELQEVLQHVARVAQLAGQVTDRLDVGGQRRPRVLEEPAGRTGQLVDRLQRVEDGLAVALPVR